MKSLTDISVNGITVGKGFGNGSNQTAIGFNTFLNKKTGNIGSAFGYQAGANDVSGNNNTFLGGNADISSNSILSNSTAVGYNAKVTASNQVVLGTSAEIVSVPGNLSYSVYNISGTYQQTAPTTTQTATLLPKGYSVYYTNTTFTPTGYFYIDGSSCIVGNTIQIANTSNQSGTVNLVVMGHVTTATFVLATTTASSTTTGSFSSITLAKGTAATFICINAATPSWLVKS